MADDYRRDYQRYKQYYLNLKRLYQKPTVRVSVFLLLSFLLVAVFSAMAIRPTLATIGQLVKDIDDKKKVHEALTAKARALDELQTNIVTVREQEGLIYNILPDSAAQGRLAQELEYSAAAMGVQLLELSVKGEKETVTVNITVGGEWEAVVQYLETTEKLDRIVQWEDLRLSKSPTTYEKQGLSIVAEANGKVFYVRN